MEIMTKTPKETQKIARKLAKEILKISKGKEKAMVIALDGELGSGKTTFVQGFVSGFNIKEKVQSPTFLIMKKIELHKHKLKAKNKFRALYHLDCYRLKRASDLNELGIKEILNDKENIVVIEWAQNVKKVLPKDAMRIRFGYKDQKTRVLDLNIESMIK